MFKKLFLVVVLLAALAGTSVAAPVTITNDLTDKHVTRPGMKLSFIPFKGLSESKDFSGYVNEQRKINIIIAPLPDSYSRIIEGFTNEALKKNGVDVKSRTELTLSGSRALIIKAVHPKAGSVWGKWIMLIADGDKCVIVNGIFPGGDVSASKDVENFIKSAAFAASTAPDKTDKK